MREKAEAKKEKSAACRRRSTLCAPVSPCPRCSTHWSMGPVPLSLAQLLPRVASLLSRLPVLLFLSAVLGPKDELGLVFGPARLPPRRVCGRRAVPLCCSMLPRRPAALAFFLPRQASALVRTAFVSAHAPPPLRPFASFVSPGRVADQRRATGNLERGPHRRPQAGAEVATRHIALASTRRAWEAPLSHVLPRQPPNRLKS